VKVAVYWMRAGSDNCRRFTLSDEHDHYEILSRLVEETAACSGPLYDKVSPMPEVEGGSGLQERDLVRLDDTLYELKSRTEFVSAFDQTAYLKPMTVDDDLT